MDSRRQPDRTKIGERYLLASRLTCGVCGGPMVGTTARGLRYYLCTHKKTSDKCSNPMVSCGKIDPVVLESIRDRILNRDMISSIVPEITRQVVQKAKDAGINHQAIRERLEVLDKEITRIIEAIASIGISDSLKVKLKALEEEKKIALLTLADAEKEAHQYSIDTKGIREMLERDISALESDDSKELRRIVMLYTEGIKIFPPPSGRRTGHKIEARLRIIRRQNNLGGDKSSPPDNMDIDAPPRGFEPLLPS